MDTDILKIVQATIPTFIFFDESYYLRERTNDIEALIQLIAQMESLQTVLEDDHQFTIAATLGYLYRIYGFEDTKQLAKAEKYFNNCLAYAIDKQDVVKEITTLIRMGEVYKYQVQHEQALKLFHKAIRICEDTGFNQQLDFAYQHLGKCLMEMKRYNDAQHQFQQALELRNQKGNLALIDSTLQALKLNSLYKGK